MTTVLNKKSSTGLSRQIQKIILDRINDGVYRPGERLDSIRVLADEFKVSKNTVVEAFRELESQECVVKIPARGIYVIDKKNSPRTTFNILLPFPEAELSAKNLPGDNLGTVMGVFQGMTEGAIKHNCRIHFFHCDEKSPIENQIEACKSFPKIDGAVFIGHQLSDLRQYFVNEGKPVVLLHYHDQPGCCQVEHDIESNMAQIVDLLVDRKYKKVGIMAANDNRSESVFKLECLRRHLIQKKLEFRSDWEFRFDWVPERSHYDELSKLLPDDLKKLPEIFFCDRINFAQDIYRLATERNWRIGRDIGVIGYASRLAYMNMQPSMTYLELPHYEQGIRAVEIMTGLIEGDKDTPREVLLKGTIHIGDSIRN